MTNQIVTPHRRGIENESLKYNLNLNNESKTKSDRKNLNNVLISRPLKLNKLDKLS